MTHKERILLAARGQMPDLLPYVPRFDLWYRSNKFRGTLPVSYRDKTPEQIAASEGWALHKVVPELLEVERHEDNLYRALGLYGLKECGYGIRFSREVEVRAVRSQDSLLVEYHTPKGVISTREVVTEEMRAAGATITWVEERAIKGAEDYDRLAYPFEQVEVVPQYERYRRWQREVGDEGVAVLMGSFAASPMLHIQRDLLDATRFFYEYHDRQKQMRKLAESLEHVYEQFLRVVCDSPAEIVLWGANYDDMITYPPYFEKEILPWLRKASRALEDKGKLLICHCDGENRGLMDLIRDSGIHVAEAVCPSPMTKVPIEEYYRRWGERLTIWGGIPPKHAPGRDGLGGGVRGIPGSFLQGSGPWPKAHSGDSRHHSSRRRLRQAEALGGGGGQAGAPSPGGRRLQAHFPGADGPHHPGGGPPSP